MKKLTMFVLVLCLVFTFNFGITPEKTYGNTPIKVAAVGDSITFGLGSSNRSLYSYPTVLQNLLGSNYTVNNYGVSSATMLKKGNLPYWNQSAFTNSTNWQPDIVLIMLGANDSKPYNWQYKSEYLSNYVEMIQHYQNLASSPIVYVALSPYVYGSEANNITGPVVNNEIIPLQRQAATLTGAKIINNHSATMNMSQNFQDIVHPNDGGYNVIAHNVYNVLSYDPNKVYRIPNRNSGKVLDVFGGSTQDGAKVIQWQYLNGTNQQWKLADAGEGYFKLINVKSGKLLDVTGGSSSNNAEIIQWPNNNAHNQQWEILSVGNGFNRIVSRNSGKELDININSTEDSAALIQWSYTGGANQQWSLIPVN